jgi:hypothetical protein
MYLEWVWYACSQNFVGSNMLLKPVQAHSLDVTLREHRPFSEPVTG